MGFEGVLDLVQEGVQWIGGMRGQLTPAYPSQFSTSGVAQTVSGVLQAGPFDSIWLRVNDLSGDQIQAIVNARTDFPKINAFYVCFAQDRVSGREHIQPLVQHGFRFHHFHQATNELIYYKWFGEGPDLVPAYASSIGGAGILLLSPDEQEVLLVFERGRWGRVGGAVNCGETHLEAAIRELKEEVAMSLDPVFPVCLVNVNNTGAARDGQINDVFMLFVARAVTKVFQVDQTEIEKAKWFKIGDLLSVWASIPFDPVKPFPREIKVGKDSVDVTVSMALTKFRHEKSWPISHGTIYADFC